MKDSLTPDEQISEAARRHVRASEELADVNRNLLALKAKQDRKAALESEIGHYREVMAGRQALAPDPVPTVPAKPAAVVPQGRNASPIAKPADAPVLTQTPGELKT